MKLLKFSCALLISVLLTFFLFVVAPAKADTIFRDTIGDAPYQDGFDLSLQDDLSMTAVFIPLPDYNWNRMLSKVSILVRITDREMKPVSSIPADENIALTVGVFPSLTKMFQDPWFESGGALLGYSSDTIEGLSAPYYIDAEGATYYRLTVDVSQIGGGIPPLPSTPALLISVGTAKYKAFIVRGNSQDSQSAGDYSGIYQGETGTGNIPTPISASYPFKFVAAAVTTKFYPCLGDLNDDRFVDDSDFVIFAAAYNKRTCSAAGMPEGCPSDFDHDGEVTDADFQIFIPAYNGMLCFG